MAAGAGGTVVMLHAVFRGVDEIGSDLEMGEGDADHHHSIGGEKEKKEDADLGDLGAASPR